MRNKASFHTPAPVRKIVESAMMVLIVTIALGVGAVALTKRPAAHLAVNTPETIETGKQAIKDAGDYFIAPYKIAWVQVCSGTRDLFCGTAVSAGAGHVAAIISALADRIAKPQLTVLP